MTRIKICGLFRDEDIAFANEAKPDYAGFVINFPKSHRSVTPVRVRELVAKLDSDIVAVGVFVDEDIHVVADLLNEGTIAIAQLHGSEDERYIERLRELAPEAVIWKAFKIASEVDIVSANNSSAYMVVLDNGQGTGESFDWSVLKSISRKYILAGGLTPELIPTAVLELSPYAIDISSGVETECVKDRAKMIEAVNAARKD